MWLTHDATPHGPILFEDTTMPQQPILEPIDRPTDLEFSFLYQMQVTYQGRSVAQRWYQEEETGLVVVQIGDDWFVVSPLYEN
ncbi:MAG: hypothetical protein CMJ19_05055 [Phycisphaeraceae bacterium]|nr:hypothetical protein [Phycisphaeraceae bacterium]